MAEQLQPILTVKQLTRFIKMKLEAEPLMQEVWIRGEISNFSHHSSGHMYFSLKDADSKVKCVMFSSLNQKLSFIPRDGALVLAKGNITVYERDGTYQLYVTAMQPDGLGSLHLAFEKLKQKLESEGLFDSQYKKKLPRFPKGIGLITSPTGSVVQDMITTLRRRFPSIYILVCPVQVQGDSAAISIANAIQLMNQQSDIDLLIVGRGGGSLEELWAFNEEKVARSIFASNLPVISAVGHETDFTIADFVADLRAATPTAAAELAVPQQAEWRQHVIETSQRMYQAITEKYNRNQAMLERLRKSPFLVNPHRWLLVQPSQRLDRIRETLHFRMMQRFKLATENHVLLNRTLERFHPATQVNQFKQRIHTANHQLLTSYRHHLKSKQHTWQSAIRQLDALSPLKVMQRGYSLVYNQDHTQVIRSTGQVEIGDSLHIQLADGQLKTTVVAKEDGFHE
jgi:exodeoxyribonuclease VII large subunit